MFGFGGSYDFLYHSFVKAGGGSSLLLCVLFYAALNMCPPARAVHECSATRGSTRCDCLLFVLQVPAGYAQAGECCQRVCRENVAHAARRGFSLDRLWEWRCMSSAALVFQLDVCVAAQRDSKHMVRAARPSPWCLVTQMLLQAPTGRERARDR